MITLKQKPFENSVGKGENAGNQHFLLSPQWFLYPAKDRNHNSSYILFVVCKCFEFGQVQNFVVCKELIVKLLLQ